MDLASIKNDIESVLGSTLSSIDTTTSGNGIYEISDGTDTYVIGVIGSSKSGSRTFAQMQKGLKPKIINAYEQSKQQQKKFFIVVPDSSAFSCSDYYIFVELLEKGNTSSSFEINEPSPFISNKVARIPKRERNNISYFLTYVPAHDSAGIKTTEYLKQYLTCFDSRPFSKYVTKITDFLPNPYRSSETMEVVLKKMWPANFLVAGAPGTGKSHKIAEKIEEAIRKELWIAEKGDTSSYSDAEFELLLQDLASKVSLNKEECFRQIIKSRVRRVTFYEEYSYENFIGCYKPVPKMQEDKHELELEDASGTKYKLSGITEAKHVTYEYEEGPFLKTYIDAITHEDEIYFLIIEEINRAKAATVFGDMFQLLDRKNGVSEYEITPESSLDKHLREVLNDHYDGTMKLPKNMFIWATMNNADQGVYPLDSAFKRRWGYLYLDVNSSNREGDIAISKGCEVRWNIFRNSLNDAILNKAHATEDKCIGAWYFNDEEIAQIKDYFEAEQNERFAMINPMADKLLIYLLNDICRIDPSVLFNSAYDNMPKIREALSGGVGLENILELEWNDIMVRDKTWRNEVKRRESEDVIEEINTDDATDDESIQEVNSNDSEGENEQ